MEEITYEDFAKLDIRIGTVVAAELIPQTDKLIKCTIDFGSKYPVKAGEGAASSSEEAAREPSNGLVDREIRTIVSGIAQWKRPEDLVGRQLPYIVNLAPRMLRGVESQGMLLAASDDGGLALLVPEREITPGTRIK